MTTRTITGNIKSLTDSAVATGTVTFEKLVTSTTGNTIHQSGVTTATTDASGDFSIALAVPASGSYRYRMILPNGASFYFSIASGASVNVATLIEAETITDQNAVVEALAGYLPLSGGTLTGALTLSGAPTVDLHAATKKYVDDNAGGGGASDVTDLTTTTGNPAEMVRVAGAGGLEYRTVAQVLADLRDSGALATPDLGVTVQGYDADLAAIAALSPSNDDVIQRKAGAWANRTMAQLLSDLSTKLNAINALTWAANSIILLTGTATASVQALAAHIVTLLQSASAADARTAIGAGTGNGDVTGPASSTDNAIPTFHSTGGKTIQANHSAVTIDDTGKMVATVPISSYSSAASGQAFGDGATSAASGAAIGYQAVAASTSVAIGRGAATSTNHVAVGYAQITTGIAGYVTKFGSQSAPGSLGHFWIYDGVDSTARIAMPDTTGDVLYGVGGMFFVRDSAGNIATGSITATAPGGTFNLFDDGGTNTLQLQVSAGGAITVQRTAGSRTYKINLSLIWL